uniref:Uncharacterized protein n=1 Tax=Cacopsylla melanoneura TaxID=428564 RepID=A0A8D8LVG8_9HEMI
MFESTRRIRYWCSVTTTRPGRFDRGCSTLEGRRSFSIPLYGGFRSNFGGVFWTIFRRGQQFSSDIFSCRREWFFGAIFSRLFRRRKFFSGIFGQGRRTFYSAIASRQFRFFLTSRRTDGNNIFFVCCR